MTNIEHKEDGDKWTNATIRKLLGEKGFIEGTTYESAGIVETRFERNFEVVYLYEFKDGSEPEIFDRLNNKVDPAGISVRNPIIQNDGSSDE